MADKPPTPLYAHWLDGEVANIALRREDPLLDGRTVVPLPDSILIGRTARRAMKVQALLGTRMVVSDMFFDSPALIDAFSDRQFLSFLTEHNEFLTQHSRPNADLLAMGVGQRWAAAASGLVRARRPVWISSAFTEHNYLQEIAASILDMKQLDLREPGATIAALFKTPHSAAIQSCLAAMDHFFKREPVEPGERPVSTYYQVLTQLAEVDVEDGQYLRAKAFIDNCQKIDSSDVAYRSAVFRALGPLELWTAREDEIWEAVVQCYNYAVEESLGLRGGTATTGRSGAPGQLLDTTSEIIGLAEALATPLPTGLNLARFTWPFDPDALSWNWILTFRNKCDHQVRDFQKAREAGDYKSKQATLDALTRHLAELINHWGTAPGGGWSIVVADNAEDLMVEGASQLGKWLDVASWAWGPARSVGGEIMRRRRVSAIANTLKFSAVELDTTLER
jgi:hypothetical protein